MRLVKRLSQQKAADIALKHRLYVSGWSLSGTLKRIRQQDTRDTIILAYEDGIPVGVAAKRKDDCYMHVFVKAAYRRQGIGTKLVQSMKDCLGEIRGVYGTEASVPFYRTFGITV